MRRARPQTRLSHSNQLRTAQLSKQLRLGQARIFQENSMFDHVKFGVSDYAAFVIGPDGHNIEVVRHATED